MFASSKPMTPNEAHSFSATRTKARRFIQYVLVYGALLLGGGFCLFIHVTKHGWDFVEHLEWSDIPVYLLAGVLAGWIYWSAKEEQYSRASTEAEQETDG